MSSARVIAAIWVFSYLAGCSCGQDRRDSAARLALTWDGFQPGCLRVSVEDLADGARRTEDTLEVSGRSGERVLALYRGEGWSDQLRVTTWAQEQDCAGATVATQMQEVTLQRGEVVPLTASLGAVDVDADGWIALSSGGTDCDDARAEDHPSATELCDERDNNCQQGPDEGFELGLECTTSAGCQGTRACTASGGVECTSDNVTWYPDGDRDGRGASDANGTVSSTCGGPAGDWAPNALDCDDGRPEVYAGAPELCDGRDNSCEGETDEGMGLGAACTGTEGCDGNTACEVDGGTRCDAPQPTSGFPDQDLDGHGTDAGTVMVCGTPQPGQSSTNDDCDDTRVTVYAGAPELCDSYDNDCDQIVDEDLGLSACTAAGNCTGTERCTPEGDRYCDFSAPPVTYFADGDRDGRGQPDSGVLFCSSPPADHVPDAGDCDDGDPYTYLAASEICDRRDNDCDSIADESGCPGGSDGGWRALTEGSTATDWYTTSAFDRANLWIAGTGPAKRVRVAEELGFSDHDGFCSGSNWTASWASAANGRGFLGGCNANAEVLSDGGFGCTQGRIVVLDSLPLACGTQKNIGDAQVEGLVGIGDDGSPQLFGVGASGYTFEWNGTANPVALDTVAGVSLRDVHGVDLSSIYAVGASATDPVQPRIYKLDASNGSWTSESVENLSGLPAGAGLNALWVVRPDLIYAVGGSGLVLRYDGSGWSLVPGPPGAGVLRSVRAFGTSSVYVASGSELYRYNGTIWELLYHHDSLPLHDLTGVAPDALWGVGDDGHVVRWP